MVDREDLVFVTCYQLSRIISDDWATPPSEVTEALDILNSFDEPGETLVSPLMSFMKMTAHLYTVSEKEPEKTIKTRTAAVCRLVVTALQTIMEHSDGWNTADSDVIKLEIQSRIVNYEQEIKNIITPVPFVSRITL